MKYIPPLDKNFAPFGKYITEYLNSTHIPLNIGIERDGGNLSVHKTFIRGTGEDIQFVERLVKALLWIKGGFKITIYGDPRIADYLRECYQKGGLREFDCEFMSKIYEKDFEVCSEPFESTPEEREQRSPIGKNRSGCRIGFDAGGSDRKVSALVNGKAVYSEEVLWLPKENDDPQYHFDGIVAALKTAASKMPRVDSIGVSSAGIYVNNRTMAASLFIKVPQDKFDSEVKDIYIRAAMEIGDLPLTVINDGDVTALAGARDLRSGCVLGIAMGTSEAGGYVDKRKRVTGWLNELAFVPVDLSPQAARDEWSGDIGCGVKYFSQDGVIKLAQAGGIRFPQGLTLAGKLKYVQELMEKRDPVAREVYRSIGCYLGHTVPLYAMFYEISHVILLGRVMSGKGGNLILSTAQQVLEEEYPELAGTINLCLPSEKSRRIGQSVTAAGL